MVESFGGDDGNDTNIAGYLELLNRRFTGAGSSGLYRLDDDGAPELVLSGPGLVGFAFDTRGGLVVCSSDTAYRLPASF